MPHLPSDAFGRYVALGVGRTYLKLAQELGVSKRTIVRRAMAEGWRERLLRVEEEARRRTEERAVEDVVAIDEKHLKMARAIQARALEALRNAPLGNGTAAVRALDVAIRIERTILGRNKPGATTGPSLAELLEASRQVSDARVAEIAAQLGQTRAPTAPTAAPTPAPTAAEPAIVSAQQPAVVAPFEHPLLARLPAGEN